MYLKNYLIKNIDKRFDYILKEINSNYTNVVYIGPRKYNHIAEKYLKGKAYIHAFEDLSKSNKAYDQLNENSLLIMDCSARYKSINGSVFKRLEKLALIPKNKILADIVPFTSDVQYAYVPYSHLERAILGYQHFYSFRENNLEYNTKGELVESHDFDLLTDKLVDYTYIDYPEFIETDIKTIYNDITKEEQEEYNNYRDELLEEYSNIQPVLTRLADYVNTRPSRLEALKETVDKLEGHTIVYTNIKSHNREIEKLFKDNENVEVKTFYDNNEEEAKADNIVLAETPIVRGYLFLDVIANAEKADFYFLTGHTTIDKLLYDRMIDELNQINEFTKLLYRKQEGLDV